MPYTTIFIRFIQVFEKKNSQPLAHTNTQLFLNMKSISKEAMHYLPFT